MQYGKYKSARNAAWRVLLESGTRELPVDLRKICSAQGCRLYSYTQGERLIRAFRAEEQTRRGDGFTILYRGTPYIFYNSEVSEGRQRFTIAHELGHVALGHLEGEGYAVRRAGNSEDETQANQFAARLLAPSCILKELTIEDAAQIAELCGMSTEAAGYRAKRLAVLKKRNKFLLHPLERRVLRQFRAFIRSRLGSQK